MPLLGIDQFYSILDPDELETPIVDWRVEIASYDPATLNVEDSLFFMWPGWRLLNDYYLFGKILLHRSDLSTDEADIIHYQNEAIDAWRHIRTLFPRLLIDRELIDWCIAFYLENIGKDLLFHAEKVNVAERHIVLSEAKDNLAEARRIYAAGHPYWELERFNYSDWTGTIDDIDNLLEAIAQSAKDNYAWVPKPIPGFFFRFITSSQEEDD